VLGAPLARDFAVPLSCAEASPEIASVSNIERINVFIKFAGISI
jgi:hypothetical protein